MKQIFGLRSEQTCKKKRKKRKCHHMMFHIKHVTPTNTFKNVSKKIFKKIYQNGIVRY